MTYSEFKRKVAAYLNRSMSELQVNGIDLIKETTNKARRQAQRLVDFELLRCSVDLEVDLTSGVDLSTAVLSGTTTPVEINRIERAYIVRNGAAYPIEVQTRSGFASRHARIIDGDLSSREASSYATTGYPTGPAFYRQGRVGYLWPADTSLYEIVSEVTDGVDNPLWPSGLWDDLIVWDDDLEWNDDPPVPSTIAVTNKARVTLDVVRFADDYDEAPELELSVTASAGPVTTGDPGPYIYYESGMVGGQPLYYYSGSGGSFIWYDESLGYWILSDRPFSLSQYWRATIAGVNALLTSPWTAVGFSPEGSVSFLTAPEHSAVSEEDFFLTDCDEWLLFFVLRQLEFYNRNRQNDRFVITQKMIDEAWAGVKAWNESLGDNAPQYDLD